MNPNQWTRSTFCSTGACAEVRYATSTHSGANGCVAVGRCDCATVQVRDSKLGADSPTLTFGTEAWQAFVEAVKTL